MPLAHGKFQETVLMPCAQLEISQGGERRAGRGSLERKSQLWQYVLAMSASWEVETGGALEIYGQLAWLKNASSRFSGRYCLKGIWCVEMQYFESITYILRDWDFCWNSQPKLITACVH